MSSQRAAVADRHRQAHHGLFPLRRFDQLDGSTISAFRINNFDVVTLTFASWTRLANGSTA